MSQAIRVLKLLQLIQGESWQKARDLAGACGVTRRQVFRDLKMLQTAGIPVSYCERTKRYRVKYDGEKVGKAAVAMRDADDVVDKQGVNAPQSPKGINGKAAKAEATGWADSLGMGRSVRLNSEQACMLLGVVGQLAGPEGIPLLKPAREVIQTLRANLSPAMRRELVRFEKRVYVHVTTDEDDGQYTDVFIKLRQAILGGITLRCRYDSGRRQSRSREAFELRPYGLFYCERAWYVLGHHSGHGEIRTLKLSRFVDMDLTTERYRIPVGFNLRKHFGKAWRMIPGKEHFHIRLEIDGRFAEAAAETRWHATRSVTWLDNGRLRFECEVDGLEEICWWVLSMGPYCQVIEPAELRQKVQLLATQTAGKYA